MPSKQGSGGPAGKRPEEPGLDMLDELVVPIAGLSLGHSSRFVPEDIDHARMLAEVSQVLPPIVLNARTMEVIAGWHQVLAARIRGENSIRARLFHGSDEAAYLFAVHSNTTHGKPLGLAERLAAASRILRSRPDLSDRVIAAICGLSLRAVAVRRRTDLTSRTTSPVGPKSRARPLNPSLARQQATDLILAFPGESNRSIGRRVGLSETTVRDVRRQIARASEAPAAIHKDRAPSSWDDTSASDNPDLRDNSGPAEETADDTMLFASWLEARRISDASWAGFLEELPLSRYPQIMSDALAIADSWRSLAANLEQRLGESDSRAE